MHIYLIGSTHGDKFIVIVEKEITKTGTRNQSGKNVGLIKCSIYILPIHNHVAGTIPLIEAYPVTIKVLATKRSADKEFLPVLKNY